MTILILYMFAGHYNNKNNTPMFNNAHIAPLFMGRLSMDQAECIQGGFKIPAGCFPILNFLILIVA